MADVTLNLATLEKALLGQVQGCHFYELINNFESYIDLGTMARNYGVDENEIVRIAYDFDVVFIVEHARAWPRWLTIDSLTKKTGIYVGASVNLPDYRAYKSGEDLNSIPNILFKFTVLDSTDISKSVANKQFQASIVSLCVHELGHILDTMNMTTEEFEVNEEITNKQRAERQKQRRMNTPVTTKYPFTENEFPQVMHEIHSLENQGLSAKEVKNQMMSIHELTDTEADELMERAMTWKEGSYRKLSDGIPVNLEYLKSCMSIPTDVQIPSTYYGVYSQLFSGAEEYFDFSRLDHEYLHGTEFSSLDILREVSKNVNLAVYDESHNEKNYPVGGVALFDYSSGYKSITLIIYLLNAKKYSLKNIARKIWFAFVHEFIHILDNVAEKDRGEKAGKHPNKIGDDIMDTYKREEKEGIPGAFREHELYPNYEAFKQAEDAGYSLRELHELGRKLWNLPPRKIDELIERSHTLVEGSYRKLSAEQIGISFGFDIYHADAKIVKQFMLDYSKEAGGYGSRKQYKYTISELFPKWEDALDITRLAYTYTNGDKDIVLAKIKDIPITVNLYLNDYASPIDRLVGGEASYKPPYVINIHLRGDLAQRVSDEEVGRQIWVVFCHEFTHILQASVMTENEQLEWGLRYKEQTQKFVPHHMKFNEREPIIEEILVKNEQGYTIEEIRRYVQNKWHLAEEEVDELMERSMVHVEGSYRRLPREQLMFYDSELDFLSKFGEDVERKPGAEFETDHGRYRLMEYHPELPGWYVDCVDWKQGAPVKAGVETEYPRLTSFVRDYILHRAKYAQSGDSKSVLVRYETLFPGYLESEEIQRLIREKLSTDVDGYLEILKNVGAPMGFITLMIRYSRKSPGQILPFFVNGDVSDSGGMSLIIDADTEDQDIQAYLPEIANHCWGFFVHEFGHMLDHFNEEDPFAMENVVPKFNKNYYPFQKSELPQAIAFIRAMEEKGKSREYLKAFAMREWELSEKAFDYLYDQAHKVASYRKFSDDENPLYVMGSSYWVSPDGQIFNAGVSGHEDWAAGVSELKFDKSSWSDQITEDWKAFAKWREKYNDLYGSDTYLGGSNLIENGWLRVTGNINPGFEVQKLDGKTIDLIIDYMLKKEYRKNTTMVLDVREPNSYYYVTFEDFISGDYRSQRMSSYRKFSDDELKSWFGSSKIVDGDGNPLLVYHGTNVESEFPSFVTRRRRSPFNPSMGAYFTDDKEAAAGVRGGASRVISTYLKMNNPLDLTDVANEDIPKTLGFTGEAERWAVRNGVAGCYQTLELLDSKYDLVPKLKRQGYDGVIFDGQDEGRTFVVFNSDQVRIVNQRISSYRKFSDDELKLKDENVDMGRILILHGEDVLPMAKEALQNHLYVEGWQAKKVFSAMLGISGIGDEYGYLRGSDDFHMAGYYNKNDRLVAWAFQYISSSISRYTERAYRYRGIGSALADALKEDLGGDLNTNERQTPRPDGVLEKKLVQMSYRKISTGKNGDVKPCYLITVSEEVKEFIHTAQELVPKEMLTGQGKPDFPEHITLLFGVPKDSIDIAKKIINETAPFEINLKEYGYFDNEDSSVLHVRCESKEMTKLHERMKKEIENTHREGSFKAHITVAYLKPDSRADGLPKIPKGMKFRVDAVQLSIPDDEDISKENFTSVGLDGK